MQDAEAYIRSSLDGTFTVVQHDGKVSTVVVDTNFMPKHVPGEAMRVTRSGYSTFTKDEDIRILSMRKQNITFDAIAAELWRNLDSVKKRYKSLIVAGGGEAALQRLLNVDQY